jgi:glycosyl transferase family 25
MIVKILTMKSAEKRQRQMSRNLETASGIASASWSFFYALSPEAAGLQYDERHTFEEYGRTLSPAELSCFASHYKIIEDFVLEGAAEYLFVLEDDVFLDPCFNFDLLPEFMSAIGVDYLRLYSRDLSPANLLNYSGRTQIYRFTWPCGGTQAYIFSRNGAEKFLNARASDRRIARPIDVELDRYWTTGNAIVALYPYPVMEMFEGTLIHTNDQMAIRRDRQTVLQARAPSTLQKIKLIFQKNQLKMRRRIAEIQFRKTDVKTGQRAATFFKARGNNVFSLPGL